MLREMLATTWSLAETHKIIGSQIIETKKKKGSTANMGWDQWHKKTASAVCAPPCVKTLGMEAMTTGTGLLVC